MKVVKELGKKIKEMRIKKKISQKTLSQIAGCKRSNIANIEGGRVYPSMPSLIKIARFLEINLNEIMENWPNTDDTPTEDNPSEEEEHPHAKLGEQILSGR